MDNVQEVALNVAAKIPYDDSWNPISIATVEISYQQEKRLWDKSPECSYLRSLLLQ